MGHWAERVALLEKGHAVDPDNGVVTGTLAWNLALVGRWREATVLARQAVDADPYSALEVTFLAELVGFGGEPGAAVDLLAGARRRFPLVADIALTDFRIAALAGDARRAGHMLDDGPNRVELRPASQALWRAILAARVDTAPAPGDAATRTILAMAADNPQVGLRTLERLVVVRHLEDARRFASSSPVADADNEDQSLLFSRLLQPLRADPRFMALAARQGLVTVWARSGQWPDFCGDKDLGYDCRAEARKLAQSTPRAATLAH
jgi:hypothetical protein